MSDYHNIESILSDNDTFCLVPTIAYALPLEEIIGFAREHEKSGTPYAITGLPLDGSDRTQFPLLQSSEWLERVCRLRSALLITVYTTDLSPQTLEHSGKAVGRPQ